MLLKGAVKGHYHETLKVKFQMTHLLDGNLKYMVFRLC